MLFIKPLIWGQHTQLNYKVMQGTTEIGWVKLHKSDSSNTSVIKLGSEIKKRVLFMFKVTENQESFFQNGLLIRSYFYRSVNKDIKADKRTSYTGNHYQVNKEKTSTQIMLSRIDYNFLSLYFLEPVYKKQVYSDNFEQLLNIEKTVEGYYKVTLPDGNTTSYYYTNGICSKVKVEQSLFTIEFVLLN